MILNDTSCCGVDEIDGLQSSPEATLKYVCRDKYDGHDDLWDSEPARSQAFIIFHDVVGPKSRPGNGQKLAAYIKKHKLGSVYAPMRPRRNPNTARQILIWTWAPNEKKLKAWWRKHS